MRTRLALTLALVAAALAGPVASAHAAYFGGQVVDGPNAGIGKLGGVALSRDGGADHVFVSFLAAGVPREPRRLDTGQLTSSSEARVSSAPNGRAVATWINGGSLWASVRPNGSSEWGSPEAVYAVSPTGDDVTSPSLSMGQSGAAYVAFEVGGDLRVARLVGT